MHTQDQWKAGEMRGKIFTGNEYSAESTFVSSPHNSFTV